MECTVCKAKKQIALKRCKHFELGGEKKQGVRIIITDTSKHDISHFLTKIFKFINFVLCFIFFRAPCKLGKRGASFCASGGLLLKGGKTQHDERNTSLFCTTIYQFNIHLQLSFSPSLAHLQIWHVFARWPTSTILYLMPPSHRILRLLISNYS